MDRRTALALALALIVFALFTALQARYAPKRPIVHPDTLRASAPAAPANAPPAAPAALAPAASGAAAALAPPPGLPETHPVIETPLYRAEFSNRGARLVSFSLKRFGAAYGASNYASHPERLPHPGHDV